MYDEVECGQKAQDGIDGRELYSEELLEHKIVSNRAHKYEIDHNYWSTYMNTSDIYCNIN